MSQAKVTQIIDQNPVVVFSKSYCGYCRATKNTLSSLGAEFFVLELDEIDDGGDIQDALYDRTKQRTVPNIFIGKEHIGGNSDLQNKLKNGSLEKLLKDAGAL